MAPEQLTESVGRLFEAWADASKVALIVTDSGGDVGFANRQCTDLCSVSAGDSILAAFHFSEQARAELLLSTLRETGRPVDFTARLATGDAVARFLISATLDDDGAVQSMISVFRDVTPQSVHEEQLRFAATHDPLTGLLSRAEVIRVLEERLEQRTGTEIVALLFVDLDDFKSVNDGYGHVVGDAVLREIAGRLEAVAGHPHAIGRMGGDEFLVVVTGPSRRLVMQLGDEIRVALAEPVLTGASLVQQRLSIGIAMSSHPLVTAEQLLVDADLAMYSAKRGSREVAVADNTTRADANRRLAIEKDLREALANDLLRMHYQPVCDLRTGEVLGAESLVRWNHLRYGYLNPVLVIERAEVIGIIDSVTEWMVERIVRDWAQIQKSIPSMRNRAVSVNLTARQLNWAGYLECHFAALERHGLDPDCFIVEVVESSQIGLGEIAETTLREIAAGGGIVALDDFGVGFNALDYFTRFPVHELKIDRALVSSLDQEATRVILRGIVQIAEKLGTSVLAEGVETEEEARACAELGMAHGQGYWFGRPLPLGEFDSQLRSGGFVRAELLAPKP